MCKILRVHFINQLKLFTPKPLLTEDCQLYSATEKKLLHWLNYKLRPHSSCSSSERVGNLNSDFSSTCEEMEGSSCMGLTRFTTLQLLFFSMCTMVIFLIKSKHQKKKILPSPQNLVFSHITVERLLLHIQSTMYKLITTVLAFCSNLRPTSRAFTPSGADLM